jgi:hypothetical protein
MEHAWKTPASEVSRATSGARVRIIGRAVRTGNDVTTPTTGTPCLAFTAHDSFLDTLDFASRVPPIAFNAVFAVEDDTGTIAIADNVPVLIDIEAIPVHAGRHSGGPAFGASVIAREEAARQGLEGSPPTIGLPRREGVLLEGMVVAVVGIVERDDRGVRLTGTHEHPLIVSTHAKAVRR